MKASVLVVLVALLVSATSLAQGFNVAEGASYVLTPTPAEGYADPDATKLTDGMYAFSWSDMIGFEGADLVTIVIDLEAVRDDVTFAALKVMRSDGSDVALPDSFIVSISEDGVLYEDLGMATAYLEEDVANDTIGTLVWQNEEWPGFGRYVRFEVRPGGTAWTMISEAMVGAGPIPSEYALPERDDAAAELGPIENVSLGRPYVLTPEPSQAYPDDGGVQVTDGSYEYTWADMIGFDTPPENPTVVIDLGEYVEGITRVSGLFMRSFQSSVNFPNSLVVSISEDGETFRDIGLATRTDPDPIENELINELYWEDTSNPVDGRYVRVVVRPRGESWTMLAEVIVRTGQE